MNNLLWIYPDHAVVDSTHNETGGSWVSASRAGSLQGEQDASKVSHHCGPGELQTTLSEEHSGLQTAA